MGVLFDNDVESCGLSARSETSLRLENSAGWCTPQAEVDQPLFYRNDPYAETGRVLYASIPSPVSSEPLQWLPEGTLHSALLHFVSFVPYPTEEFISMPPPVLTSHHAMPRLFIGQLPYGVTDMQLDWLCSTFAGAAVYYPERIVKRDDNRGGAKMPTGCVHAYCDPETVDHIVRALHKRVLFDDTGVWYAADEFEGDALANYCQQMKDDKRRRIQHRPYDSMVVQRATSTYVPAAFFGSHRA